MRSTSGMDGSADALFPQLVEVDGTAPRMARYPTGQELDVIRVTVVGAKQIGERLRVLRKGGPGSVDRRMCIRVRWRQPSSGLGRMAVRGGGNTSTAAARPDTPGNADGAPRSWARRGLIMSKQSDAELERWKQEGNREATKAKLDSLSVFGSRRHKEEYVDEFGILGRKDHNRKHSEKLAVGWWGNAINITIAIAAGTAAIVEALAYSTHQNNAHAGTRPPGGTTSVASTPARPRTAEAQRFLNAMLIPLVSSRYAASERRLGGRSASP